MITYDILKKTGREFFLFRPNAMKSVSVIKSLTARVQDESPSESPGLNSVGALFLGPILGMIYVLLLPVVFLFIFMMLLPGIAMAKSNAALSESAQMCLGCHSDKGLTKKFSNNEQMSVFVDANHFAGSVHSMFSCDSCHPDMMSKHPGREFKSREDFAVKSSLACRQCHSDESLKKKQMHYIAITQAKAPPCAECHGAHSAKRATSLQTSSNQYCITCHKYKMTKSLNNGEKMSLFIDTAELKGSVHNKHACNDCHTEFSAKNHPVREFDSSRKHSIAVSEACKKCHADKNQVIKDSIHYNLSFQVGDTMISKGSMNAPVCIDCHGFHSVGPKAIYDTLSGVPCKKCHEGAFEMYSKSMHGVAKSKGMHSAPLCSSCHSAHEVNPAAMADRIRTACLGCHKTALSMHSRWLPNTALHLSSVACAACHSPNSGKGIYLKLQDEATGKPFTEQQIVALLGTTYEGLFRKLDAHGDGIDSAELWDIVKKLNEKGSNAKVTFVGKMDVTSRSDAHALVSKEDAIRECEDCHQKGSANFKNVKIAVVRANGKTSQFNAKPEVLGSMTSMLSLRQFYVLGSTRLGILDWVGLLMVFGGISVPIVHLSLRKLTEPIRKAKEMNRMNKEAKR